MINKGLESIKSIISSPFNLANKTDKAIRKELSKIDLKKIVISKEASDLVDRMPKLLGSKNYDPWGYNPETAKIGLTFIKFLYDYYFRVSAHGLKNIPTSGPAFVISNHSGQLPMDGTLIGIALATNPNGPRAPRAMIERFFPTVPFVYSLLTAFGAIIGDPINCIKMLENDEVVIVFPEGVRGSGKPYKKRYQLQYMGTGFVRIAIQTKSPIIPVGVVGCEETMPSLGSIDILAKMLAVPYIPVAPPLPLPARVYINFGKPLYFDGDLDNEPEMIEKVEIVKKEINKLIQYGLSQRGKRYYI